jgi:prephenate dehydratase
VTTELDHAPDRSVGYLGPAGTFTHRTVLADPTLAALRHVPCADPGELVTRLTDGAVTYGVLPWENSVAGLVGPTADLLAGLGQDQTGDWLERGPVRLHRDVVIPVRFQLVGWDGARPDSLWTVSSHPHALNQCRAWLAGHAPQASQVAARSTAAALDVAMSDPTGRTAAVTPAAVPLTPPVAAAGAARVIVLADDIGESTSAETRFIVLGRDEPARTGRERTVIACFQPRDRPGSLMTVLEPFARAGIDLLRIESRPTRDGLGRYYFLIEWRGHPDDSRPGAVLRELAARTVRVRVLGTFDEPVPSRPALCLPGAGR